jgi:hypothetical protein
MAVPAVRRPALLGSWTLVLAVLPGSPALAYWQVTPQAQVGITYESNPRYFTKAEEAQQLERNPEAADDALGVYLDAQLQGLLKTPSSQVTLTPRIRRTDYLRSNEDLNDADSYLNFSSTHRGTLGSVGLDAGYQKTGVRSSEFESATPSEPDAPPPEIGGSGQFSDTTQETWDIQPSLTFQLSPRNAISVSGGFSETKYDERTASSTVNGGQLDYRNSSVELNLRHFLNPKNSFIVALNGGNFLAEQDGNVFKNSTDSFGITTAYEHTFSERLTGTANIGVSRSSVEVSGLAVGTFPIRNEERNFVGNVTLRRRAEQGYLNFSLGRRVAPGSSGSEVVQDTLRLAFDRNLTPTLTGSLATIVQQQSAVGRVFQPGSNISALVRQDRTYISADSSLSWRMTETLSLLGTYTYVFNKNDVASANNNEETNNRLYLGVLYRGVGLRR